MIKVESQRLEQHVNVQPVQPENSNILAYDATQRRWVYSTHITDRNPYGAVIFRGTQDPTYTEQYYEHDLVVDGDYTGIALVDTTDKLAPIGQGDTYNVYQGSSPTASTTAKKLTFGAVYNAQEALFIHGYRLYQIAGNVYSVYKMIDNGAITQLISYEASTTGWVDQPVDTVLVSAGSEFMLFAITNLPNPTPITWAGNWNYTVPQNANVPVIGEAMHPTKALGSLRFNKTDNDGGDRSVALEALSAGDTISGVGMDWTIQATTDNVTWMNFAVVPQEQGAPTGVATFTFETVSPAEIFTVVDVGYHAGDPAIQGIIGADVSIDDIVPDDNQYGIDLTIQQASISPDWFILP